MLRKACRSASWSDPELESRHAVIIEASSSGAKSLNTQVFVYVAAALVPLSVSVAATDFSADDQLRGHIEQEQTSSA